MFDVKRVKRSDIRMPGAGKQIIVAASCLLIAFGDVVSGQGPSPAFPQQRNPARTPGSRLSIKRTPANNQNQASYSNALRRYRHERHNRFWWKRHFTAIVLAGGGYYYWDAGYWCPAWGYDPSYESYDYDGPIYTYGNLLPDHVIVNVQRALKQLGYYAGGLTGSLGPASRQALANYQEDAGLDATGAIDAATVEALGLQ
jgi:hypothetical protein